MTIGQDYPSPNRPDENERALDRSRLTQTELAVRAALKVRPDMTASEALTAVEVVRRP